MRTLLPLSLMLLVACDAPAVVPREGNEAPPRASTASDARAAAPADAASAPPPGRAAAGPGGTAAGPGGGAPTPEAEAVLARIDAMKEILEGRESPVEIEVSIGSLYYEAGRYLEAVDWYRRALEHAEPVVQARRRLLEAGVQPAGEVAAGDGGGVACAPHGAPGAFARGAERAQALAEEGKRPEALACYDRLMQPLAQALARRGAAWSLLGQRDEGLKELDRALELVPDDPEALYLIGAAVFHEPPADLDGPMARKGQAAWMRFLALNPDHPQAESVRRNLEQLEALRGHGDE